MRSILTIALLWLTALQLAAGDYVPKDVVWTSQSRNSSESMPCGGHDIGMNVWVEGGDLLFYAQQSGWFDENNTLLKAGRWRLHIDGNPFGGEDFEQRLCLNDGAVYVKGGGVQVRLWVDVFEPVVFVAMTSQHTGHSKRSHTGSRSHTGGATLSYESWRYRDRIVTKAECQQCSYKWLVPADCTTFADSITAADGRLTFCHRNRELTVFDFTVAREGLDDIKDSLYNPIGSLTMEGEMLAPDFRFTGVTTGAYASTDYRSWNFSCEKLKKGTISIRLNTAKERPTSKQNTAKGLHSHRMDSTPNPTLRREGLGVESVISARRSSRWWHDYWQRSWIRSDTDDDALQQMLRNYELMRYMLGCNAQGQWPTKFNGGLFTFDPVYVDSTMAFTPDYRKWGGGTMTAQNQRLVYWPLLRSGDTDVLRPQIDTYMRLLPNAVMRTRHYWGHGGASFTEQMENFGLPNPAEYGKHKDGDDWGVERNAWLEYEWDTALEFCMMALLTDYPQADTLAAQCLRFFDEHYQWQARRLGSKALDSKGHLVIYPGSGCETYKMAYNPASTIAALKAVAEELEKKGNGTISQSFTARIPDIPLRVIDGDTCIAPAAAWARIQNVETPQLYPVWPWRLYSICREGAGIGRNTYMKDPHAIEMRSSKGWKQDNIWAACLGMTSEAQRLNLEKLSNGPYRFTAFWDPGFDWAPDHNRGGAGMAGLQQMLLQQAPDGKPILFPAWPKQWQCSFRLYTDDGTMVEASTP
jgi:hypothetical protein